MAWKTGFEPCFRPNPIGRTARRAVPWHVQMTCSSLRTFHDLEPAMTGWSAYVAAERIALSTANDQQPRGY